MLAAAVYLEEDTIDFLSQMENGEGLETWTSTSEEAAGLSTLRQKRQA